MDGNDSLIEHHDDDVLDGGSHADTFVFSSTSDSTSSEADTIDLSVLGLIGFSDLTVSDNGVNTFVDVNGSSFRIALSRVLALDATDFIF